MSIEADVPLVLQQMGRVQKLAEQEKNRPERQQATARDAAQKGGELERDHVAKAQSTEQTHMDVDKDGHGGGGAFSSRRESSDEPEDVETNPSSQNAWQGKIVDTKV